MNKRILLIPVILVLVSISGAAQNSMLRGKVRGPNGAIVNNATVELREAAGGVASQSVTRNDGDFAFPRLRPGEYELVVTMVGYETATQVVQLRDSMRLSTPSDAVSEIVTVEIVLRPKAEPVLGPPGTSFVQDVPKAAREAFVKGMSKIREGKSDEGIALLREAAAEYHDYFDAYAALGSEFYRRGEDTEALEALERARQINDRGAGVYYTFGMVMVRQQKFRAAEYAFGKAAELNDSHVAAHFNHAVALIEVAIRTTDRVKVKPILTRAEQELDRAWELSDKKLNTVFLQRARVHEERGDKEAAARELETYLKTGPDAKDAAAVKEAIAKLRGAKK
ncbi:MAG: carboxypeptidase regulatory-like domain-containing protein [Blastocatellia bacterium]